MERNLSTRQVPGYFWIRRTVCVVSRCHCQRWAQDLKYAARINLIKLPSLHRPRLRSSPRLNRPSGQFSHLYFIDGVIEEVSDWWCVFQMRWAPRASEPRGRNPIWLARKEQ